MHDLKSNTLFQRMDDYELALCLRLNRASRQGAVRHLFAAASRLGNGVFWYVLVVALPLAYGLSAVPASLHMSGVAIAGLLVYKVLKTRMVRERPFITHKDIHLGSAPLDRYSFPSGHTLHAVSFSIIAITYHPELAWLLVPFAALVALSRVVLGLHYPTDVGAGAVIGALLAVASFAFV